MNIKEIEERELALRKRLESLKELEASVREKEKNLKAKENAKKQILLRLSSSLWEDISQWADEDYRSINGQIEFLLREAVRKRKNKEK